VNRYYFYLLLFWSLCFAKLSHGSLSVDSFGPDTSPALAQLECAQGTLNRRTISLGGVLATQLNSISDIVLVAAHGLEGNFEQCVVIFNGHRLGVTRVEKGGTEDVHGDWAVVTVDGRFPDPIQRFGWHIESANEWESFASDGGRVSLMKFLNGYPGAPCEVRVPRGEMSDTRDRDAILLSDCLSIPGMSGAPAIVEFGGIPVIMGLSIGTRYNLSDASSGLRMRANVIRLFDASIEEAVVRSIASELK